MEALEEIEEDNTKKGRLRRCRNTNRIQGTWDQGKVVEGEIDVIRKGMLSLVLPEI